MYNTGGLIKGPLAKVTLSLKRSCKDPWFVCARATHSPRPATSLRTTSCTWKEPQGVADTCQNLRNSRWASNGKPGMQCATTWCAGAGLCRPRRLHMRSAPALCLVNDSPESTPASNSRTSRQAPSGNRRGLQTALCNQDLRAWRPPSLQSHPPSECDPAEL